MRNRLNKKVVVITGAARGLGKALAEQFDDAFLVLCSKEGVGPEKVDVSRKPEVQKFIRGILKKFSRIDILINNAGAIHLGKPIEKISDREFDLCLKTNLNSVFYALREVIPAMRKRKSGTIITISSTAGKRGNPLFAAYSTSKFAVNGLMESAARQLNGSGVRCLTILPAGMNTPMRKYILGEKDAQKQQSPETVAKVIKKAAEDAKRFPNGSEIEIRDGKISRARLLD